MSVNLVASGSPMNPLERCADRARDPPTTNDTIFPDSRDTAKEGNGELDGEIRERTAKSESSEPMGDGREQAGRTRVK